MRKLTNLRIKEISILFGEPPAVRDAKILLAKGEDVAKRKALEAQVLAIANDLRRNLKAQHKQHEDMARKVFEAVARQVETQVKKLAAFYDRTLADVRRDEIRRLEDRRRAQVNPRRWMRGRENLARQDEDIYDRKMADDAFIDKYGRNR